ncbi:MAG: acyl-[acyl-carrier-protein]--UDP-N-acetylglucosamine O-acyltransferase [Ignavibacteria bacterium]|nr:MAG: acyl-[acyl-carrier-protein]--UDP-N-acetylglucosamine O-acyltransferase [Ignavibacteria bacterium]
MPTIHPTALVDSKAELADDVVVGPFCTIEADVTIDAGTKLGPQVRVDNGARVGKNCAIHQGAVVATPPQDLKYANEKTEFILGDNCTVREYCTLNRATTHSFKTIVGSDCLLMAYVHVAHDCRVGDKVIIANSTQLGGHVIVGEQAIIGGLTAVHQFSHIGMHSMTGGAVKVTKDIPPYVLAGTSAGLFEGLNSIGLRRRGFPRETIDLLDQTYRAIYRSGMNVSQAVAWIKENLEVIPEVQNVLDFIADSDRGIIKLARR